MEKTRSIVIAIAIVAVVSGVFVSMRATDDAPPPAVPAPAPPPAVTSPNIAPEIPASVVAEIAAPGSEVSGPEVLAGAAPANDGEIIDGIPRSEFRAATAPVESPTVPVGAGSEWVRAFQKQERDDAWARPLEAEIQKSLEPGVNLGRFYVANVECRTTLCEIRLQARGSLQVAELEMFQSEIIGMPWVGRLNGALSSGSGNRDRYEAVWIFEKMPESPAGN